MGKVLLIGRLAARDVRHHLAQALLLVIAIAAAAATLTMALALNGVTSQPYQRTRAATRGPDVVAYLTSPAQAKALVHARGVTASSGPYPIASAVVRVDGLSAAVLVQGRTKAPAPVDRPEVLAGSWVRPGGVVIERTFAEALGVRVGDELTLNDRRFTVAGIAVTAAQSPYPNLCADGAGGCGITMRYLSQAFGVGPRKVGLMWTTESDAIGLASKFNPLDIYVVNLKLADAAAANTLMNRFPGPSGASPFEGPLFVTSSTIASADGLLVQDGQGVLRTGTLLLGLLALGSVAVLVGSRLAEHRRRVGLLKAIGATPGLVASTFLAENLVLALIAAALGLVGGWLVAPLLTSPGAALVGTAGAPSLTLHTAAVVVVVALVVALASAVVPAVRAAHSSTVDALADAARPPKRRGWLIRLSSRLSVPALFGLRLVARRPRRALLSAATVAVTVAGIVAVLAFHTYVDVKTNLSVGRFAQGLGNPVVSRDEQMLLVITIMLVTLSVLTAIFTAWATALDARHASSVIRGLGATPRQVRTGFADAQVFSALPGVVLGVPLGLALFDGAAGVWAIPSALWLVATVLGTLLVVAGLTTVPARIATRSSVAELLQLEAV